MAQANPPTPPRHGYGPVCRLYIGGSMYDIV